MKKIKLIIFPILMFILLMLIGELFVWNVDSFETNYIRTTFCLRPNQEKDKMFKDLQQTAKKHHLEIFTLERDIKSIRNENVTVYGNEQVAQILKDKSEIKAGAFTSMTLGDVQVSFKELDEYPHPDLYTEYYLIGDIEDARLYKKELINQYDGSFPREGYLYFNPSVTMVVMFSLVSVFLIILSLFHSNLIKKEVLLRFVYGDSIDSIIAKNIIGETSYFVGVFVILFATLKYVGKIQVDYKIHVTLALFVAYLLLNALIYLRLKFIDYKRSLNNAENNKIFLQFSYIFQAVLSFGVIILLAFSIEMISTSVNYISQKDFFEERSSYSYVNNNLSMNQAETEGEDCFIEQEKYISNFLKEWDDKRFSLNYCGEGDFTNRPIIYANGQALSYIEEHLTDINGQFSDDKINFLVPSTNSVQANADLEMLSNMYFGEDTECVASATYSTGNIIAIARELVIYSNYYKNPLIILDLRHDKEFPFNDIYFNQLAMYEIDDESWENHIAQSNVDVLTSHKTNVYEYYQTFLYSSIRFLILGLVFLTILTILYFIMLKSILTLVIKFKSKELLLKTVLGYTLLEKYGQVYLYSLMPLVIALLASMVAVVFLQLTNILAIVIAGVVTLGLALMIVTHLIKKIDQENIRKNIYSGGL
ncbi:hypothetical protein SAMN05421767_10296 [Granulicatella balaenopterae]|uniref:Uncharacterized protein n=1 Tax=Granulicatella balaenopterae TaxID=137733 RepID=A0A1H9HGQ7_9LACT|nr:hypothetical protein [Granulicatella balaenopterae]SEQ61487.1 hypothetical protein SAMN05421767_10296 [Granulicatella balaenopterae]